MLNLLFLFFLYPALAVNVWEDELRPTLIEAKKPEHLSVIAAGVVATIGAERYDQKVRHFRNEEGNLLLGKKESLKTDHVTYGVLQVATAAGLFYADTKEGVRLAKALVLTSVTHLTLSRIIRRDRPGKKDSYSMPSGHTSSMFAYAGTLAGSYGWRAGVPAYAAASLTALSRIKEDDHWVSDVVAGIFLGSYWARVVHAKGASAWTVVPAKVGDGGMLSFIRNWD